MCTCPDEMNRVHLFLVCLSNILHTWFLLELDIHLTIRLDIQLNIQLDIQLNIQLDIQLDVNLDNHLHI